MRRPRFTIRGMMIAVVIVAFVLAMLRYPTPLWAGATFTLAVGLFLYSIPSIVYRRGRKRAFWVGFAVFGWGHLLCFLLAIDFHRGGPYLLTTSFAFLLMVLSNPVSPTASHLIEIMFGTNFGRVEESSMVSLLSLISLVVAYAGGIAVARMYVRGDRDVSKDAGPSDDLPMPMGSS